MSRLAGEISPYLLAHKDNPIWWFPWGEDAFAEAKKRDVPVLVSIGYHTCHWCHVMARESFASPETAAIVNDNLVSIKVDREERPDVDNHYMAAAQAFTSHLGWPLNVFVTPDGHPFYAATYLPPTARSGQPSFTDVVLAVSAAWTERRDEVEKSAAGLSDSLRVALAYRDEASEDALDVDRVISQLVTLEDPEYGGFSGSQKFPMAPVLTFLLDATDDPRAAALADRTLDVMATSDLRDPIEGGFFRYATQPDWTIPHYERMLTDNALLLSCYARAGKVDVAEGIVSFLKNQMAVEGGLASAQHSESIVDGQLSEGGYYLLDAAGRAAHEPPELDKKVITGWMGLVLSGLANAERAGISGSGVWAEELAETLLATHRPKPGVFHRVSLGGHLSSAPATLEDYGGLALGLLDLARVTGDVRWADVAKELVDECAEAGGGTRLVSASTPDPVIHQLSGGENDITEGATPSGAALISQAASALWVLTGSENYRDLARATASVGAAIVTTHPLGAGGFASALLRSEATHWAIVVVDDNQDSELRHIATTVDSGRATVITVTRKQAQRFAQAGCELFARRGDESGVAYICQNQVCEKPDRHPDEFASHLASLGLIDNRDGEQL